YPSVFSVAATDSNNQRAPYSNFGHSIALAAPGGNTNAGASGGVLSTIASKDSQGNREPSFAYYQGTSMASPHAAGVFALMKAVYPALDPDTLELLLASGELTDDLGPIGRDPLFGHGLINARK